MIEVGFIIFSFLAPLAVLFSYRKGISDGKRIDQGKPLPPVLPKIRKQAGENREERKLRTILDNIDRYNGGPIGQKEVK